MTNTIKLPQLAWYGSSESNLPVPDSWQVGVYNMEGFNVPAMKLEQIRAAIQKPIGSPRIGKLAKNKQEVAIIFDDMSRVTRVAQIVPFVLEELVEAGIPDNRIRFISALGCHGTMGRFDFVRKLGEEVVSRFPVYNHNALDNSCTYVGTTSKGIRVLANAEVMKCDFKIGIGSIAPHVLLGFSGGSKIVLPGITSIGTNEALHRLGAKVKQERHLGMGIYKDNPLRQEIDEAATIVGLNYKIDCICNMWGETTHIFSGNPQSTFTAGVEIAKKHYLSTRATDNDVVIANIFAKVNEPQGGMSNTIPSVSSQGGDLILICNAPDGHVIHYLLGTFGRNSGGPMSGKFKLPHHINRLIIFSEYPDPTLACSCSPENKVILVNTWEKVLKLFENGNHVRGNVKVAVYPNAEIQYCA